MDKKQKKINIYTPNLNSNKLYFKKTIYRRKNFIDSLSPKESNLNFTQVTKFHNRNKTSLFSNIKSYNIRNEKNEIFHTISSLNKNFQRKYLYQKNNIYYNNVKSVILIQKCIKGFLTRKKIRNKIQRKLNIKDNNKIFGKNKTMSILNAIKKNSYQQKNTIKVANNILNRKKKMNKQKTINTIEDNLFKKKLVYIRRNKDSYSLEKIAKLKKVSKTFGQANITFNFDKDSEIINKKNDKNHETFFPEETNFNSNIRSINSKPSKDTDINIDISSLQKNLENTFSFPFSELSLSFEQCPQNITKINSDEAKDKDEKNLNINNENFVNEKRKVIKYRGISPICNKKNLINRISYQNKKKIILNKLSQTNISRNPTKENSTLDKNYENEVFIGLDSSKNKNNQRSLKDICLNNKNNDKFSKKDILEIEEKKSRNKKQIKEKTKSIKNTNKNFNKKDLNSFHNSNKYNQIFARNLNSTKNLFKNHSNKINNKNILENIIKKNNIFESIKEEKLKESDTNEIKSSFYEKEDFAIISYDYTLNDKNKLLSISKAEDFNINGVLNKKYKFIIILKNIIRKNIYKYIFKLLNKKKKY